MGKLKVMKTNQTHETDDKLRNYRFRGKGWPGKVVLSVFFALLLIGSLAGCSASHKDVSSSASKPEAISAQAPSMEVKDQKAKADTTKTNNNQAVAVAADLTTAVKDKTTAPAVTSAPLNVTPAIGNEGSEGFNRKLIYKANLVMPVKDYAAAQTQLRDFVALSGAYILQFSENMNTGEKGGSFTIKVAANGFVSLLDGLEKISPSLQRNV